MGKKNLIIRNYFTYDEVKKVQVCQIGNCQKHLAGDHSTNMIRHIEIKHPEKFFEYNLKSINQNETGSKLNVKAIRIFHSEELLWDGCVQMVAHNALPFSFISSPGFQQIINPITKELNIQKQFNATNLKEKLNEKVIQIKNDIKASVKTKMISLKIDCVTRHARSMLGINVQYIDEKLQLKIKTLAVREIYTSHTAENLKIIVLDVLKDFGISLKQIYTITSDNGSNMIKLTINLLETLKLRILEEIDDDIDEENNTEDIDDIEMIGHEDVLEIENSGNSEDLENNDSIVVTENEEKGIFYLI